MAVENPLIVPSFSALLVERELKSMQFHKIFDISSLGCGTIWGDA